MEQAEERALYLAGDRGTLAAEWARHLPFPWRAEVNDRRLHRLVFQLSFKLDRIFDLRDPDIQRHFGIEFSLGWLADMDRTRQLSQAIRLRTTAQAIIVPSIAFVDDHTQWNLVVFLDKVPDDTVSGIMKVEPVGNFQWD